MFKRRTGDPATVAHETGPQWRLKSNNLRGLLAAAGAVSCMDRQLLYRDAGATDTMLRIGFGLTALTVLFMTYWFHPTTAWVVLGTTFTLAVANRVRQHDVAEAEGALQAVDD